MYKTGKLYKIVNDVNTEIYVGSTCATLNRRKVMHRNDMRMDRSIHLYKHLRELNLTIDDCRIILIEEYPCEKLIHLRQREQHWIDTLKPKYNKNRAYTSEKLRKEQKKIWEINNKEKRVMQHKIRYQRNRKEILKRKKLYLEKLKNKIFICPNCNCKISHGVNKIVQSD